MFWLQKSVLKRGFLDICLTTCFGVYKFGCRKVFLIRTEYFSSAIDVLTNSPNIQDIVKNDIFLINFPRIGEKYDKSALLQISPMFGIL